MDKHHKHLLLGLGLGTTGVAAVTVPIAIIATNGGFTSDKKLPLDTDNKALNRLNEIKESDIEGLDSTKYATDITQKPSYLIDGVEIVTNVFTNNKGEMIVKLHYEVDGFKADRDLTMENFLKTDEHIKAKLDEILAGVTQDDFKLDKNEIPSHNSIPDSIKKNTVDIMITHISDDDSGTYTLELTAELNGIHSSRILIIGEFKTPQMKANDMITRDLWNKFNIDKNILPSMQTDDNKKLKQGVTGYTVGDNPEINDIAGDITFKVTSHYLGKVSQDDIKIHTITEKEYYEKELKSIFDNNFDISKIITLDKNILPSENTVQKLNSDIKNNKGSINKNDYTINVESITSDDDKGALTINFVNTITVNNTNHYSVKKSITISSGFLTTHQRFNQNETKWFNALTVNDIKGIDTNLSAIDPRQIPVLTRNNTNIISNIKRENNKITIELGYKLDDGTNLSKTLEFNCAQLIDLSTDKELLRNMIPVLSNFDLNTENLTNDLDSTNFTRYQQIDGTLQYSSRFSTNGFVLPDHTKMQYSIDNNIWSDTIPQNLHFKDILYYKIVPDNGYAFEKEYLQESLKLNKISAITSLIGVTLYEGFEILEGVTISPNAFNQSQLPNTLSWYDQNHNKQSNTQGITTGWYVGKA